MGRRRLAASLQSLLERKGRSYVSVSRPKPNREHGTDGNIPSCVLPTMAFRNDGRVLRKESRHEFAPFRRFASQGLELCTMASAIPQSRFRVDRLNSLSRAFRYEQRCGHTSGQDFEGAELISVTFVDKDGEETKIQVPVGMSMLEAAHENGIELEGACEGSLACSTCHVIVMISCEGAESDWDSVRIVLRFSKYSNVLPKTVEILDRELNEQGPDPIDNFKLPDEDMYTKLPEPSDEENDMLDLAFGLTETSRLGCQVIAKPELDGLHLALPAATRNFAVDGHVPKPH